MASNNAKLIAVIGATGHQGDAVVRALQGGSQFKVRALTRNPGKHRELADALARVECRARQRRNCCGAER